MRELLRDAAVAPDANLGPPALPHQSHGCAEAPRRLSYRRLTQISGGCYAKLALLRKVNGPLRKAGGRNAMPAAAAQCRAAAGELPGSAGIENLKHLGQVPFGHSAGRRSARKPAAQHLFQVLSAA